MVFAVCVGFTACAADDDDDVAAPSGTKDAAVPPDDGPSVAGKSGSGGRSGAGGSAGAGASGTGGSGGRPESDAGSTGTATSVQDRCIIEPCGKSQLPAQPELEFLEDTGEGWQRLMEMDWHLAAGAEGYRCMTFTVREDVFISAFNAQVPTGTHHATFGISAEPTEPDSVYPCGVGNQGERKLQGAGAGTEPTTLPDGVAMPVRAGNQIFMNLHLFNVSDQALSGRSGMWIKTVPAADVEHEAETVLAGPLQLNIPVGRSTQTGSCTLRADATLYALAPHMHQKGVHMRATVMTAGGERVLYDDAYDFSHQLLHDIDDVQLKAGNRVELECTYMNDTELPLRWGDSSLQEMCFISLNLYPAIGYGSLPCSG
jgi:hypothetical protein